MPVRRFSDAKDFGTLARMLDEERLAQAQGSSEEWAPLEILGRAAESATLTRGVLIQAGAQRMLRRAGASESIAANGVVTQMMANGAAKWAPLAMIWLRLAGTSTATPRAIYLGNFGQATLSEPTTGFLQPIGKVIFYDSTRDQYLCLVNPSDVLGVQLGG